MQWIEVNGKQFRVSEKEAEAWEKHSELPEDVRAMSSGVISSSVIGPAEPTKGSSGVDSGGDSGVTDDVGGDAVDRVDDSAGDHDDGSPGDSGSGASGGADDSSRGEEVADEERTVVDTSVWSRSIGDPPYAPLRSDVTPPLPRRTLPDIPRRSPDEQSIADERTGECWHEVAMLVQVAVFGRPEKDLDVVQTLARRLYLGFGDAIKVDVLINGVPRTFKLGPEGKLIPLEDVVL